MTHYTISVFGKVQQVFFRDSARRQARKLTITGFARNEPDGSVHIEAEGTKENLDMFVKWIRKGPPLARVDRVEIEEHPLVYFGTFGIRY